MVRAKIFILVSCVFVQGFGAPVPDGNEISSNDLSQLHTQDYDAMLDTQIKAHPVILYTGSTCGLSRASKNFLNTKYPSLRYDYVDYDTVQGGDWLMGSVIRKTGSMKLPFIFVCGQYIGGKSAMLNLHESGELKTMFGKCANYK